MYELLGIQSQVFKVSVLYLTVITVLKPGSIFILKEKPSFFNKFLFLFTLKVLLLNEENHLK